MDFVTRSFEFQSSGWKHSLIGSASSSNKHKVSGQWDSDTDMHLLSDLLELCLKSKELYNISFLSLLILEKQ